MTKNNSKRNTTLIVFLVITIVLVIALLLYFLLPIRENRGEIHQTLPLVNHGKIYSNQQFDLDYDYVQNKPIFSYNGKINGVPKSVNDLLTENE